MKEVTRRPQYEGVLAKIDSVLEGERDPVVWMATVCSLLKQDLGFFWVGFYRVVEGELRIGPYQGTPGCLRISFDRGVCGACARGRESLIVPDVHEFPGHIACDGRSRSEIVVPVEDSEGQLVSVLDVDSTKRADFDEEDRRFLEEIAFKMRAASWPIQD